MLGFVLRITKKFKKPHSVIALYNSLVRSILEYASVIWSPFYDTHIQTLESVQRRFLRILSFRFGYKYKLNNYESRLAFFKVDSLENRRRLLDMFCLYKIVNNKIDTVVLSQIALDCRTRSGRRFKLFYVSTCRINVSYNSPVHRLCRLYNQIHTTDCDIDIFWNSYPTYRRLVYTAIKELK